MINRNRYIIQEQATLKEIWEYVPCTCDEECACRKFGSTHHWKLKEGLTFDDILPAFLRMFVDKRSHEKLIENLMSDKPVPSALNNRVKGAYDILCWVRDNWDTLYTNAVSYNHSLLCDNWSSDFWEERWQFPISAPIYKSKVMSVFLPDTAIPHDTKSLQIMKSVLRLSAYDSYYSLLEKIREYCIDVSRKEKLSISEFRRLDSPVKCSPFNHNHINLKSSEFDYGVGFTPEERPLSRVIDKIFYRPG